MQPCQSWMFQEPWYLQRQREGNVISRQNEKDPCTRPTLENQILADTAKSDRLGRPAFEDQRGERLSMPGSIRAQKKRSKPTSTAWHKRLGHLNFQSLKRHLQRLSIDFIDNSKGVKKKKSQRSTSATILKSESIHKRLGRTNQINSFLEQNVITLRLRMTLQGTTRYTLESKRAISLDAWRRSITSAKLGPTPNDQSIASGYIMDPNCEARR